MFLRCRIAIWLDRQKDRLENLIEYISPDEQTWEAWNAHWLQNTAEGEDRYGKLKE